MDAASVAELVGNEHPQVIATILAHLDADQAAGVLGALNEPLRSDVVLRIATLESVQPAAMQDLNDVLAQLLSGGAPAGKSALDGVEAAAEILNRMGAMEAAVSSHIREVDPDLAQRIEDRMWCSTTCRLMTATCSPAARGAVRDAGAGAECWRALQDKFKNLRSAPRRCCARTSRPGGRCGCPRWRPSSARSCASRTAWPARVWWC
jgi:hypothetical protein